MIRIGDLAFWPTLSGKLLYGGRQTIGEPGKRDNPVDKRIEVSFFVVALWSFSHALWMWDSEVFAFIVEFFDTINKNTMGGFASYKRSSEIALFDFIFVRYIGIFVKDG